MAKQQKAKARPLKVFRTSIGFHDAYVAAPTKKAALEAWGSKKDLFARGAAELVEDPELGRAALASPGTVIKVSRGSVAEQLAALPGEPVARPGRTKSGKDSGLESHAPTRPKPAPPPAPKPSRQDLDTVESEIDAVSKTQAKAIAKIAEREAGLATERRELVDAQNREMAALDDRREKVRQAYDAAMKKWRS